ncbi:MAG: Asp-tRNA(Asn)/Glu-tRNA(Gln) amidotransferase subunit GatC [Bacilli bacterium]|jgi:aspartyl/glutamyl-tRNA(Asn/Gln) amidotransferase C subunit|nr:Asp-tRNA(Asn)/Glu-tRNA(Gln) amidotransferase subunit GatC [Mollicutes bacterium]
MITKENLKKYANKLMFDMNEEEYETLQKEFEIILKQMDIIDKIPNISEVNPMTFPFDLEKELRPDETKDLITPEEALINAKEKINNEVKVPKVVE